MPLWNPLPTGFLNTNRSSANLTGVGTPLRPVSGLAAELLYLLAEFPRARFRGYRHTLSPDYHRQTTRGGAIFSMVRGWVHVRSLRSNVSNTATSSATIASQSPQGRAHITVANQSRGVGDSCHLSLPCCSSVRWTYSLTRAPRPDAVVEPSQGCVHGMAGRWYCWAHRGVGFLECRSDSGKEMQIGRASCRESGQI